MTTLKPASVVQAPSARSRFQLPKLFDFERFKRLFRKSYRSLVEELARRKLFLARAFRAFIAGAKYKMGLRSSYLAVNRMSDWTRSEVQATFMGPDALLPYGARAANATGRAEAASSPELVQPVASEEEIALELERHKGEPGIAELTGERARRKRSFDLAAPEHQLSLDDIFKAPDRVHESPEVAYKISRYVETNNPDYEPAPELPPFSLDGVEPPVEERPMPEQEAGLLASLPGSGLVGSLVRAASDKWLPEGWAERRQGGDVVYVDHRRSNCLSLPREQDRCGSCYVFASLALYEWLYCQQTGQVVEFSEQYVLDCSMGSLGCSGGNPMHVSYFVLDYGLELRSHYPYKARQDQCPYPLERTDPKHMGYIRPLSPGVFAAKEVARELEESPLIVLMQLSLDFVEYGGGVDVSHACDRNSNHAMLLVGSGREDGTEYWLFRNSHGPDWGERGHYKLAKWSPCLKFETGDTPVFGSTAYFGSPHDQDSRELTKNRLYKAEPVQRRLAEYQEELARGGPAGSGSGSGSGSAQASPDALMQLLSSMMQ